MVMFIDVDPDEIPRFTEGRRGRVSYPILKSFLETGKVLVKLDRTGIQQSLQGLNSSLGAYIRSHDLPIKIFTRSGELYLMRTDSDEKGQVGYASIDDFNRVKHSTSAPKELLNDDSIPEITDDEVAKRFESEKGQVTK